MYVVYLCVPVPTGIWGDVVCARPYQRHKEGYQLRSQEAGTPCGLWFHHQHF